jgi:hypothetical protein
LFGKRLFFEAAAPSSISSSSNKLSSIAQNEIDLWLEEGDQKKFEQNGATIHVPEEGKIRLTGRVVLNANDIF